MRMSASSCAQFNNPSHYSIQCFVYVPCFVPEGRNQSRAVKGLQRRRKDVRQRDVSDLNVLVAPFVEELDVAHLGGDILGQHIVGAGFDLNFPVRHVGSRLTVSRRVDIRGRKGGLVVVGDFVQVVLLVSSSRERGRDLKLKIQLSTFA